jgi:hypothetical protein
VATSTVHVGEIFWGVYAMQELNTLRNNRGSGVYIVLLKAALHHARFQGNDL